jgi:hypothetical protein
MVMDTKTAGAAADIDRARVRALTEREMTKLRERTQSSKQR